MNPRVISGQADVCLMRAADCRRRAEAATDPHLKNDLLDIERRWRTLAASYTLAAKISAHLEWTTQWLRAA